jgi:hypothetical protein
MRREIRCLLLLSVALVAFSPIHSVAQEIDDLPLWGPCGPPPRLDEPLPRAAPGDYPSDAECPCFTPGRLAVLSPQPPDVCMDSGLVIQVSGWFGQQGPDGREGFNVIATESSSRTTGGACLYHRRIQRGGAIDQEYSRRIDLPHDLAATCHEMLESWLAARGGCTPEIPAGTEP